MLVASRFCRAAGAAWKRCGDGVGVVLLEPAQLVLWISGVLLRLFCQRFGDEARGYQRAGPVPTTVEFGWLASCRPNPLIAARRAAASGDPRALSYGAQGSCLPVV